MVYTGEMTNTSDIMEQEIMITPEHFCITKIGDHYKEINRYGTIIDDHQTDFQARLSLFVNAS